VRVTIRRAASLEEIEAAGALTAEAYRADRLVDPEDAYLDELTDARRRAQEAILLVALVPRASPEESARTGADGTGETAGAPSTAASSESARGVGSGHDDANQGEPAAEPDVVVGSITLAPYGTSYAEIAEPGELELRMLAVAPEARGRGIAESLMRATMREAVLLGYRRVVLSTMDAMVAAQRLYDRLGWTRVPERDWGHVEIHLRVFTWQAAEAPGPAVERATWPPLRVEEVEGFQLGLSGGLTRRANCAVLASGSWDTADSHALARRLGAVEADYRLAGLTPCVRVDGPVATAGAGGGGSSGRDASGPTTTADRVLAARGYRDVSATFVLVRSLSGDLPGVDPPEGVGIDVTDAPDDAWHDVWLGGRAAENQAEREVGRAILTGVPARYVSATRHGQVVGVARVCVVPVGRGPGSDVPVWAGLSCLTVVAEHRGNGIGGVLTARALAEARIGGADRAFSQVLVRSTAAIEFHERLGFVVAGAYRYAELDGAMSDTITPGSAQGAAPGSTIPESTDGALHGEPPA